MKRKITALFLATALVLAYAAPSVLATVSDPEVIFINSEDIGITPYASEDFSQTQVKLYTTNNSGGMAVYAYAAGKYVSSSIGIQEIEVYAGNSFFNSYGPYSKTNATNYDRTTSFTGKSGTKYFAYVTFFITRADGTVVTTTRVTDTVTAN